MDRRKSHRIHADALIELESIFKVNQYPTVDSLQDLADRHCLNLDKIKNWFNNRKAKEKRLHDQEFAEKIRRLKLNDDLFQSVIPTQDGFLDINNPTDLTWKSYIAMRDRILDLQHILGFISDHPTPNECPLLVRDIHAQLVSGLNNISDYNMDRSVSVRVQGTPIEVYAVFVDAMSHPSNTSFQLNDLANSRLHELLMLCPTIYASVNLGLGINSIEVTRMHPQWGMVSGALDSHGWHLTFQVSLSPQPVNHSQ